MANKQEKATSRTRNRVQRIFGGEAFIDFFLRYKYLILLALSLLVSRMYNGYQAEDVLMQISKLKTETKKLKFESLITESELVKLGRPSIVRKKVEASGLNLKESREAPGIVYVEK